MKYKVTGEVTFKFEIPVRADVEEDAIDMALNCIKSGGRPFVTGVLLSKAIATKNIQTEVIYESD